MARLLEFLGPILSPVLTFWCPMLIGAVLLLSAGVYFVPRGRRLRYLLCSLGAVLVPVISLTLYLWRHKERNQVADVEYWGISLLIGLVFIASSRSLAWVRLLLGLAYIPIMGTYLIGYALYFLCAAFGDCL